MDKFLKFAASVALLIAGCGVFYHFVIFLPNIERAKADQAEQDKQAKAKEDAARLGAYNLCNSSAELGYKLNWAAACKDVASTRAAELAGCLSDNSILTNPYMGSNYCRNTFGSSDDSANCSLPHQRAEPIEQALSEEKQRCLSQAKLGL